MPRSSPSLAYRTRRRWTIIDAQAALAELAASGLSLRAFAAREGLDAQRLHRWRHRLASAPDVDRPTSPAFVELGPRAPELVEVVLKSGRLLRVPESVDAGALVRLVEALERSDAC